ncbi:MAG: hypothetical protein ACI9K2_006009, partial [Myxococcota bacterium]
EDRWSLAVSGWCRRGLRCANGVARESGEIVGGPPGG